jgi:hypothetical protein
VEAVGGVWFLSFTFFIDPDDLSRLRESQRIMMEIDLQQRLICYRCGTEVGDTWIRNLTKRNMDGSYAEFLLGPKCRAELGVERPTEYKCENSIEMMPVTDNAKGRRVEIE